jgi:hypothetical protein
VHDLSAEELTPRHPRHGAENVMRKRTALLAVVMRFLNSKAVADWAEITLGF